MTRPYPAAAAAALIVLGGALSASASAATAVPATPATPSVVSAAATPEAVQRFGACVAGGGQGDLLLLIDRSGSLRESDPKNARVTAAKYLVEQVASLAARNSLKLDVAVAGFDTTYEKVTDWTPVVRGRNAVLQSLSSFAQQNRGADTDYWNALSGARRELAARGAGSEGRCSAIVQFTDGEYSLLTRGSDGSSIENLGGPKPYARKNTLGTKGDLAAAIKVGKQDLCRPGGVADQARAQDISTFGIGLSSNEKPDFRFFRNITTGEGGCGKIGTPVPGAFFEAENIRDLFFGFDQIAGGGTPAVVQTGEVCGATVCPEGTHSFVLDASIGKIHALADSDAVGGSVRLTNPAGESLKLARSAKASGEIPGGTVSWQWLGDGSVSVDVERADDSAWTGQWGLTFAAPDPAGKVSRSSLRVFGDIVPAWAKATTSVLRSGETLDDLSFQLLHLDGSAVDATTLSPATTLSATLLLADGTSIPVGDALRGAAIAAPQRLDLTGIQPGRATLRLALAVTTNDWESLGKTVKGTALEPQVKDYAVAIRTPANYPSLAKSVDFGTIIEAGQVSGTVAVDGAGCAWLDRATITTAPADAPGIAVTSSATGADSCTGGSLPLALTSDGIGDGLVSGSAVVMVVPEDRTAPPVAVPVSFTADMQRPLDAGVFLLALIGLTVLGIAVPIGLLYLAKYLTAKIPGSNLSAGSVRGSVSDVGSFLDDGCALSPHQLQSQALPNGGARTVTIDGKVLSTKAGVGLTEPGYVVVDYPGRISGAGPTGAQAKGRARLPLAVQGHWCAALDPTSPRAGEVEVTFFTTTGAPGWDTLVSDARRDLPEVVRILRDGLTQVGPDALADAAGAADPWAGGTPTGAGMVDPWSSPSHQVGGTAGAPNSPTQRPFPPAGAPPAGPPADPWGPPPAGGPPQGGVVSPNPPPPEW